MKTSNLKHSFLTGLATLVSACGLHAADLTWDADTLTPGAQDGTNVWNTVTNTWWNGSANVTWNNATPDNAIFGAGSGAAAPVLVPGNTTNTVGNITFNAPGSGTYGIAAGSSTTSKLNLSGNPTITVASGVVATNLVVLSGTSFTKLGAGTLIIKPGAANINSGPTFVGAGTLVIGSSNNRLLIPGDLTVTNGSTAQLGASEQIADSALITVNGATFDTAGKNETIGGLIVDNNAQVIGSSSSAAITNSTLYDVRSGVIFPNLTGAAGLTKTTAGTVILTNGAGANTYTGPTLISAGILDLGHSGAGNGLPGGTVTITPGGMLRQGKDTQFNTNATLNVAGGTYELLAHNDTVGTLILDNSGQILNGGSQSKTLTVNTNMDFRNGLCASVLGGAGGMVKSTAGTVTLSLDNLYSGGTLISGGILVLGDGSSTNRGKIGAGPVTNNAALVLNHSGAFNLTNSISGTGSLTNLGGSPSITGANTYAGGTTVSGGTLFVNNASGSGTGSGAVSVKSGAGLGGTGTIGGAVSILSAGQLVPGNGGLGTLSVNGSLTLSAGSSSTFQVDGTTPANDAVAAGSTVTYGGVLTISTSGAFTAGQQFLLFTGAGATNASNFASLVGSPGANLAFNFTNGVLSVVSTGSTPPTLSLAQSGSTLTFTWTDAAFKLQSQTNSLNKGLGTNWSDYPGGGSSPVGVTVDPANPSVFFRLSQ